MKALVAFDDLDASNGVRTLADGTVRYEIELDLSTANSEKLKQDLAPWLAAMKHAKTAARPAPRPKASSTVIPPEVEKYLPPARSKERRDYLRELRAWADAAGRSAEYATQYGDTTYQYPLSLVLDYVKHLEG